MEYYWSKDTINRRINDLKRLYNETKSISEKRNIMNQINYINNFRKCISSNRGKKITLLDAYIELKRYVESEKFLSPYLNEFSKNVTLNEEIIPLDDIDFSSDELVSLMHSFFKTMPKEIFEKYLKNYNKRQSHMVFVTPKLNEIEAGYAILIPSLKKNYLSISKYGNIGDVFTTIHEMGHAVFSDLNVKAKFNLNGYKDEIFPITLELLASDFLNKYYPEDARKYLTNYNKIISLGSINFQKFNDLMQIEKEYGRLFKNSKDLLTAASIANISSNELEEICSFDAFPELYEQISYLFAVELYYMYQINPNKFENVIKSIANFDSEDAIDTINYIISLGIIPNEHIKEFQDKINEKSKEYVKKPEN